MRVAIVTDWLTNQGGSERVVWSLHKAYPKAPIFTSVYNAEALPKFTGLDIRTSFLQKWPLAKTRHQLFPTLRAIAFEQFDFSEFDVVISATSAEAKGVITKPSTLHISYIYTPTRYYWSEHSFYIKRPGFGLLNPIVKMVMPGLSSKMRQWDFIAAQRPDILVGISTAVVKRINKYYRRSAVIVSPPIELSRFKVGSKQRQGFIIVSRLIPYKRVDLAILACKRLDEPLTVIGRGGELEHLQKIAGPKTRFITNASDERVAAELEQAKAFIFPQEEDFGITALEAMACGTPVIAYAKGGALDTVIDKQTGILFKEQTVDDLVRAIKQLADSEFNPKQLRKYALSFNEPFFIRQIRDLVEAEHQKYQSRYL